MHNLLNLDKCNFARLLYIWTSLHGKISWHNYTIIIFLHYSNTILSPCVDTLFWDQSDLIQKLNRIIWKQSNYTRIKFHTGIYTSITMME